MDERKGYIIYVVIFCAITSDVYSSLSRTTLVNLNKTWSDAAEHCREQFPAGHLASQSDISLLENRYTIPDSFSIWVSENVVLTPWMKVIGCFEENAITQYIQNHLILDNNRPGLCKLWCISFAYFAVKDSSCYCLNNSFVGNATRSDLCSECQTDAYEDSVNEYCGGTSTVNVYMGDSIDGIVGSQCNTNVGTGCNCLVAECTSEFRYYNKICTSSQSGICGNGNIATGTANTWSNKISRCISDSETYLKSQKNDTRRVICQPEFTSQYWIGIYRTGTRINFTAVMDPAVCGRCVFGNGSCAVIESPECNYLRPFVCKYNEIEVTTIAGSSSTEATENTETIENTTPTDGGGGGASKSIIIGSVIVVMFVIGAVILCVVIRKHRRKDSTQGQESVTNIQNNHQHTSTKQMTSTSDEEEHEYDVTNRTGRKQSDVENTYDHMFSTMNDSNIKNNNQRTSPKQMTSASNEEEHEYDVTNRTGRKQSDVENNYDHVFSTMNEEGVYNSLNRRKQSNKDISDNVYDHAIKVDNNFYDVANTQHHVEVVVTAENTYDETDIR